MSNFADSTTAPSLIPVGLTAPKRTGFCRLAGIYSLLEKLMFGRALERARFYHLGQLQGCRDILLLGEGDGRCLARLMKIAPCARIHCVDSSPAMLARSAARLNEAERARVSFIHADVSDWRPPPAAYDAVVTVFFLDCLSAAAVRHLAVNLQPGLRPAARWLWVDFVLPSHGLERWRAQCWLYAMYGFFRRSVGLATWTLPPSVDILRAAGWRPMVQRKFRGIFALSAVFSR